MPGIDSYTKLCIVSDGITDGNTAFNDLSNSEHPIVVHADVQHSTDYPLFGFTSIEFDGDSGFLSIEHANDEEEPGTWASDADFDFGTSDYTLELRAKFTAISGTFFHISYAHGVNTWTDIVLGIGSGGVVYFSQDYTLSGTPTGYRRITSSTGIDDGEYHHVELVRAGGTYKLFVDGVSEGSQTTSGSVVSLVSNTGVNIGSYSYGTSFFFGGDLDQIRISKGIARHTSNFTPSDESFDDLIIGLGEVTPPLHSLDSSGTFPTFGFCEFNTPAPWLSSVGNNPILGYVEFNAPLPTFTAAEMSLGYVEIDTPAVTLTATGSFPIFGWTEFNTPKAVVDSVADNQVIGFCNINTKLVKLFSEGGGTVLINTKSVSLDSTGVMAYPGFGEINTPRVSLSAYGTQSLVAIVNMIPPRPKLISRSTGSSGYEVIKYRR